MLENVQITWRGIMHDSTGYSRASREHVVSLHNLGVNLRVEQATFGSQPIQIRDDHQQIINKLAKVPLDNSKTKVLVYHLQPFSCNPYIEKEKFDYVVCTTAWETTRLDPKWFPNANLIDALILPSQQNRHAAIESGVEVPVYVVSYGADTGFFKNTTDRSLFDDVKDTFNFLSVFQWQHRKAPEVLLEAYLREFRETEPVALIIKTHLGAEMKRSHQLGIIDRIQHVKNAVEKQIGRKGGKIFLTTDVFTDVEMIKLYGLSDCFVLPTRGEGVGMPFMESMASGRPCIATGWGGQMDFLTSQNSYPVDYTLRQCKASEQQAISPYFSSVFTNDMEWAECKLEHLSKTMRHAYQNQNEVKQKGQQAYSDMLAMTWEKSGEALREALTQITTVPKRQLPHDGRASSVSITYLP